jgi:hypothetical protein
VHANAMIPYIQNPEVAKKKIAADARKETKCDGGRHARQIRVRGPAGSSTLG